MNNQESKEIVCQNNYCKEIIPISYKTLKVNSTIKCPRCRVKLDIKIPEDVVEHIKNITVLKKQ